ncbi:MAG: GNAT family N-acetyltransferase, partial [Acinetobacter sp.]
LKAVAHLFNQYRIFYGQADDLERAYQFLTERFKNKQSYIFTATIAKKVIGFAQVYPTFSSVGAKAIFVLNDLFIEKEYRGLGIGKELIHAVIEHAQQESIDTIVLETAIDNHVAQRLYEKTGFYKETGMNTYMFKYDNTNSEYH